MKIGVFDSGIGGKAIADSLQLAFPAADILLVDDREHLPYGDRTADDITRLTDTAIQPLLAAHCDVIVIACNSATAAAIDTLRARYPDQKFIGLEPMVKPATQLTKTGVVTICATPATLGSDRYSRLKRTYGEHMKILEPDCREWARMIEDDEVNERHVRNTIENALGANADVIVLACTHYHWIKALIEKVAAGRAVVIDPSEAIIRRVRELLQRG
jgi:glutamate racemase